MNDCCSNALPASDRPRSAGDCLQRGLRTQRLPPLPIQGATATAPNQLWAAFSLELDACGCLVEIRFRAACCATLIAYCEALVELAAGQPVAAAAGIDAARLLSALSGVPASKRDRAPLAVSAFHLALRACQEHSA